MESKEQVIIDGRAMELSTGKVAKQADGACLVRFGESVVLVTACFRKESRPDVDFQYLSVGEQTEVVRGFLASTLKSLQGRGSARR